MNDSFKQRLATLDPQTLEMFHHQLRTCPVEAAFNTLFYARLPVEMSEVVAYKQQFLAPLPHVNQPSAINPQPINPAPRAHRPMSHPRNGRIAKLPEPIRNQVNEMLDQNLEYRRIIDFLEEQGITGIQLCHISRWKEGGYLDYRTHQDRCDELELRRQYAGELARECQGDNFDEASGKLLTVLFYEALNRIDSSAVGHIRNDPKQIISLFRSFISFRRQCLAEKQFLANEDRRHRREQETRALSPSTHNPQPGSGNGDPNP